MKVAWNVYPNGLIKLVTSPPPQSPRSWGSLGESQSRLLRFNSQLCHLVVHLLWNPGQSICFSSLLSPIHFACAADVSRLHVYCFLLHLYIASFPHHFPSQPEVSAPTVVFFCPGIKKGCHTCAQCSDHMFDLNCSQLCSCLARHYIYILDYNIVRIKKIKNVNLSLAPKRCFSEKIKLGKFKQNLKLGMYLKEKFLVWKQFHGLDLSIAFNYS